MALTDAEAVGFEIYVNWLYSGMIRIGVSEPAQSSKPLAYEKNCLFLCFVLADLIQEDAFYNASVDCLIEVIGGRSGFYSTLGPVLYEALPDSTPVLQLFVDLWIHSGTASWVTSKAAPDTANFWKAVTEGLFEKVASGRQGGFTKPWLQDRCRYHKHRSEEAEAEKVASA